jgi:hypothetical protein
MASHQKIYGGTIFLKLVSKLERISNQVCHYSAQDCKTFFGLQNDVGAAPFCLLDISPTDKNHSQKGERSYPGKIMSYLMFG